MRKKPIIFTLFAAVIVGVALTAWQVFQPSFDDRWENVPTGMSKDQVEDILGNPNQIYPAGGVQSDSLVGTIVATWLLDSFHERWAYGHRRHLESSPTFPYVAVAMDGFMIPEDDDYVVYFSIDGKVIKKSRPSRSKEVESIDQRPVSVDARSR